jgi:hypothetical protein
VVYSAENPSRATQIGRSDAHQYHAGRESAAGLPGHARLRPSRSLAATAPLAAVRHAQTPPPSRRAKNSKTSLDQHGYYSGVLSFGPLTKISKRGKSPGIRENVATLLSAVVVERLIFRDSTKQNPRGRRPRLQPDATADEAVGPPEERIPGDGAQQMNQLAEGRVGRQSNTAGPDQCRRFVVGRAGGGGSITWSRRANPTTFRSSTKP